MEIQVKEEGGTGLHKTIREISLVYKVLKVERIAKKLKQLKEEPSTLESNHHDVIGLQNLGSSTDSSPPVILEEEESRL